MNAFEIILCTLAVLAAIVVIAAVIGGSMIDRHWND